MKKILGLAAVLLMFAGAGYAVFGTHESDAKAQEERKERIKEANQAVQKQTEKADQKKADLPKTNPADWNLVLVGPDNKIQQEVNENEDLTTLADGHLINKKIEADYQGFASAAEAAGFPLVMVSGYRSVAAQQEVFNQNVQLLMGQKGISEEEATAETKQTITEPGFSEHHTGLAVDVVDREWYNNHQGNVLDASYGDQPGAKWIAEHAPEYGFIVRYPKDRESITKITYEPWHLRYVGKENAAYITKHNLTLEEFLNQLKEK